MSFREKIPEIVIDEEKIDGSFKNSLAKMLYLSPENIMEILGKIFFELGYRDGKKIELKKVTNAGAALDLDFALSDGRPCSMKIYIRSWQGLLGLTFTDQDNNLYNYDYSTIINDSGLNAQLFLKNFVYNRHNSNGTNATFSYSRYNGEANYSFTTPIGTDPKRFKEIILNIKYNKNFLGIDKEPISANERALMKYLANVPSSTDITKMFKDIVSLSFNGDISACSKFGLEIIFDKWNATTSSHNKLTTDAIEFSDNELTRFRMLHKGRKNCSIKNSGAIVELIGNGLMNYHILYSKRKCHSIFHTDMSTANSLVDENAVKGTCKALIATFPDQAEKFISGIDINDSPNDDNQMSFFDSGFSKVKK